MEATLSLLAPLATCAIQLVKNHIICPLITISYCFVVFSAALLTIKILFKLRYEVFNEDLKYQPSKCKNKVLVITGATSGIGLAATKFLHAKGFIVIACYYCKDEPGYEELKDMAARPNHRGSFFLVELNVRCQESIETCHQQVCNILALDRSLEFHALINVAGLAFLHRFQWQPRDKILALLQTNLYGPLMMARQFMPMLVKNAPHSRLINVSSPLGTFSGPYNSVYGATKAGVTHFTNSLRIDAIRYGIKAVTIQPGNLIRNTNILHESLTTSHISLLSTLTDEEKQLYEHELARHELLKVKMDKLKYKPVDLRIKFRAKISRSFTKLMLILSGALGNQTLDQSNLMNSFDNAVRVRDPPKEMFAGNRIFEIIIGAIIDVLCHSILRDLGFFLAKHNLINIG